MAPAEAGGVLVAGFRWHILGREGDAQLPVGSILDGGYGKREIGFDMNVHGVNGLCW